MKFRFHKYFENWRISITHIQYKQSPRLADKDIDNFANHERKKWSQIENNYDELWKRIVRSG